MKKTVPEANPAIVRTADVPCPQCGTMVPWSPASRWKPFCSERCKLLDLGAWANESYRIAGAEVVDVAEVEDILEALARNSGTPHTH